MLDVFWMVFVDGASQPRKQWEGKGDAMVEAERLARQTGKPAYLLEVVAVCTLAQEPIQPIHWEVK